MLGWVSIIAKTKSLPCNIPVIDKEADSHTPVGRGQHAVHNEFGGDVAVEDVVLQVQCTLCSIDQQYPGDKRINPGRKEVKAGFPRVAVKLGLDSSPQAGLLWLGQCCGGSARVVKRETRASAQD